MGASQQRAKEHFYNFEYKEDRINREETGEGKEETRKREEGKEILKENYEIVTKGCYMGVCIIDFFIGKK